MVGEKEILKDEDYDLISVIYHASQGCETTRQYAAADCGCTPVDVFLLAYGMMRISLPSGDLRRWRSGGDPARPATTCFTSS
jgi:hypothetical protein